MPFTPEEQGNILAYMGVSRRYLQFRGDRTLQTAIDAVGADDVLSAQARKYMARIAHLDARIEEADDFYLSTSVENGEEKLSGWHQLEAFKTLGRTEIGRLARLLAVYPEGDYYAPVAPQPAGYYGY